MIEMTVPIQKIPDGFSFIKSRAPMPTHTGAKLANRVEMVAFESIMDEFQSAMSQANKMPQIMAILTPRRSVMGFLK